MPACPRIPSIVRALLLVALVHLAGLAASLGSACPAFAGDETDDGGAAPRAAPSDRCATSHACYHFLNAPISAPDPCFCPRCTPTSRHAGDRVPDGWSASCFVRRSLACFLKRHAASWRLSCSACLADTDCCPEPHPGRCPICGDTTGPGPWRKDAAEVVAERLAVEKRHWDKAEPVVVVGRHFYVVTDLRTVKVVTHRDGLRVVSGHEYAHILVMRAEAARRDFETRFGTPGIAGQTGIFVPDRDTTGRKLRSDYFRNENVPFIYSAYGSLSESAISEGFCPNGVCIPFQKVGDDTSLHEALRQFLGQIFFSTWIVQSGDLKTTPPWAFAGIGFWLGRSPAALADEVYWREGEDNTVSGSGRGWSRMVLDAAKKGGLRPIDEILAATTLAKLRPDDFRQVWSWFETAMEDVPKEWVALMGELRRGTEVREAFRKSLGWTPAEFQDRFADRLLGLRRTLRDGKSGAAAEGALSAERDTTKLEARLRGIGTPADAATVRQILDVCGREGDRVRETAVLALARTKDPAAREAIGAHGLAHADPKVRATALRLVRVLRLGGAKAGVRAAFTDPAWYVRAEAMLAAAAIRDFDSQAVMREALVGPEPKLRIAACDAIRMLGPEANPVCVPLLAKCASHDAWQVRVAAAEALAIVGTVGPGATVESVDALVGRIETETARVADAFRDALVAISGEDLGSRPANWVKWWEHERPNALARGGFPPQPPRKPQVASRYADPPPTYHGVELWSARVGFVLDVSRSTNRNFRPPEEFARRLFGDAASGTVQTACQGEIAATLRSLDSRTSIALWCFSDTVAAWNRGMVPATRSNIDSASGWVRSRSPDGETDFHAALRASLGFDDADPWSARLPSGPDTLAFLTDGSPTCGEITDPEVLLAWATEVNRYARVRIHTIAMGGLGVDQEFLGRLAARSGGQFRQVREQH